MCHESVENTNFCHDVDSIVNIALSATVFELFDVE